MCYDLIWTSYFVTFCLGFLFYYPEIHFKLFILYNLLPICSNFGQDIWRTFSNGKESICMSVCVLQEFTCHGVHVELWGYLWALVLTLGVVLRWGLLLTTAQGLLDGQLSSVDPTISSSYLPTGASLIAEWVYCIQLSIVFIFMVLGISAQIFLFPQRCSMNLLLSPISLSLLVFLLVATFSSYMHMKICLNMYITFLWLWTSQKLKS